MSNKKSKTETSVANLIKPKKYYLYECHCIRCCGKKVDPRTQEKHTADERLWKLKENRKNQENSIMARKKKSTNLISNVNPPKKRKRDDAESSQPNKPNNENIPTDSFTDSFQLNNEDISPNSFTDSFQLNNEENIRILSSNFHIPALNNGDNYFDKECDQYYIYQEEEDNDDDGIDQEEEEDDGDGIDQEEEEDDGDGIDQEEEDDDDYGIDQEEEEDDGDGIDQEEEEDDEDNTKNFFACPEIDSNEEFVMESLNDSIETEIIIWVFKFQQRFRLSDMALEALIKFLCIVLTRLNKSQSKNFPTSLYMAKKMLNIFQPKMQLAVCTNCHKLHNVKEIIAYKEDGKVTTMNCLHEEYPDNPHSHKCNNPLSTLLKKKGVTIPVPRLLYPKPSIRHQLSMLYQRPDFENMLKLSGIQREDNIYSDIYDGEVWKSFPFNGNAFFTPGTVTTNLGLLINLDWFQPFTYTQHSTGAIYASICNLPRTERNKPENIIYLSFLPGPKEVGLDRINHYLAPVIDEL